MIDSHLHLDHPAFQDDLEAVLARALSDGISGFVNIGFDRDSARATAALVEKYPFCFGVVGVHPHDAVKWNEPLERELEALLKRERLLAVGEIGLDYYYDHSPRDVQRDVFRRMLSLARRARKPVVIHCRDAAADVLEILEAEGTPEGGIFHAFGGDAALARRVVGLGFHVGVGGVVTFKNSSLPEALAEVPFERVVLETDSPYISPHPFRGRRNEPALMRFSADAVARVYGIPLEEVARRTTDNLVDALDIVPESLPGGVYNLGENVYIHSTDVDVAAVDAAATTAVICGHTEPIDYIPRFRGVAGALRERGLRVRLLAGARGRVDFEPGVGRDLAGMVDSVTVRFFGATAVQHERTAMTGLGPAAFESLVGLVEECVAAGIETECLFVAAPKVKLDPCRALAERLGTGFAVRKYGAMG
jgi:TatD DNase family protein